ncbi:MAG TPA: transketolase [Candidatus Omnitrophica bacterium]|nr:MAG: transketolase [Omnitrophica WOR_2 bacterium GWA2_63_20]OGX35595.1 MAG: transketolase [Omnitrophica WOR_2 bacterium RIFCSPHIGHO2_02_FULL_63_39]OGX46305.1 MAG: transketolase [Omnitrophica WOR_2 bacterium RIFCSPLOWO2_02_FULL_63_16]OGX47084.1 MAG: transketolase [Omnitrophica WOR_2 bacterium RIFCSPLOWO2_12_FULL_63_16]HBH97343.1 transketolase [Candidatus Omnitrophota bacterium]
MSDKPTRDGFGEGLLELGRSNPNVVALSGDLEDSARAVWFKKEFPDRFFSVGIAEQDMIGTAAGLAWAGKIAFACSFSQFVTGKALEQFRLAVCYQRLNVKTAGSHGGLSVGADGATAEALEELSHMRVLPHMTVIVPCDAMEAKQATIASASYPGPVFLRLGRAPVPTVTKPDDAFTIGKANVLRHGADVAIIACGTMVAHALEAAARLARERIESRVINLHTIKPIDEDALIAAARETGAIVTVEEHTVLGGLGGAVAEVVVRHHPVPMRFVGVLDRFGTSGDPAELLRAFHLMPDDIASAVKDVLHAKR